MIFCFSGTGNSRYIARRIAAAMQYGIVDLNKKIRTNTIRVSERAEM